VVLILVFVFASFCTGFALKDILNGNKPSWAAFQALMKTEDAQATPTEVFKEHYGVIQARSYRPVNANRLKYAAMQGMMSSLGDPHTMFMEPTTAENFAIDTRGDFVGVGARLGEDLLGARVVVVFKGTPADRSGLKRGDIVVAVDDTSVGGMSTLEIVSYVRGEEGTIVELQVLREGEDDPIPIRIKRARVIIPTSEMIWMKDQRVSYISISQFAETTTEQFRESMIEAMKTDPKGIVIDLRSNPGGLLDTAIDMLDLLVEDREVVTLEDRNGRVESHRTRKGIIAKLTKEGSKASGPFFSASGDSVDWGGPVAILINEDSASASEIFAGVLQQYDLAKLFGEHTYGKASVQNVIPLIEGSSAKITIRRYYLPNRLDISRRVDDDGQYISGGLLPDYPVELEINSDTMLGEPGRDSQLDRAIEWIEAQS
jgi:carboxyl-terminal processing protease